MTKMKNREEIEEKYKWDVSLLVKDQEEYEHLKKEALTYLDKICALKNHIFDDTNTLLSYVQNTISLDEIIRKLYVYVGLQRYVDLSDQKAQQKVLEIEDLCNKISSSLAFVKTEIIAQEEETLEKLSKGNQELETAQFYFQDILRAKKHILSEREEELLSKMARSYGSSEDTFDILNDSEENIGSVLIDDKEIEISQSNFTDLMNHKDKSVREKIFKTYFTFYKNHKNTFSSLYATNVLEDVNISEIRKYPSSLSMALDSENINREVYENLLASVHKNMASNHEYQKIKNKILGIEDAHIYDNYLKYESEEDNSYDIETCKSILREALKPLGSDYLKKLDFMFNSKYIDYLPCKNKRSGAFQWHRFVMLNHLDTYDSLTTMAHELGHAMNTLYTEEKQPIMYQENPIFLAEIASTLNEVLLNEYNLKHANTREEKIKVLMDFLSRVNSTIYRQTMFAEFEYITHKSREEGISLTEEFMSGEYYKLVEKYFDKSITLDEEIKYEWMRIPHFYTSFYVYKYAIGLIVALIFAKRILDGEDKALENYLNFLSSGSSDYPLTILKKAGIDLTKQEVFDEAFSLIREKIETLKEVVNCE